MTPIMGLLGGGWKKALVTAGELGLSEPLCIAAYRVLTAAVQDSSVAGQGVPMISGLRREHGGV